MDIKKRYIGNNGKPILTAIHDALVNGELSDIKKLLKIGSNVNTRCPYGFTALHCNPCADNISCHKFLLDNGADVNALDRYGHTPLDFAIKDHRTELINLLTERGGKKGKN